MCVCVCVCVCVGGGGGGGGGGGILTYKYNSSTQYRLELHSKCNVLLFCKLCVHLIIIVVCALMRKAHFCALL